MSQIFEVSVIHASTGSSGLGRTADREKVAASITGPVYILGRLMQQVVDGKRLADTIAAGGKWNPSALKVNDKVLPLVEGFSLSLASIGTWACPTCGSAHGAGTGPSSEVSANRLATCEFYYQPSTKRLFTVSSTCWRQYFKARGLASRFVQVPPAEPPAKASK